MAPFGRRIVRNFLLFALVPLFAFAWHAHRQVSAELMRSASERHRRDVGSAGVILVERLLLAANDLARSNSDDRGRLTGRAHFVARESFAEIRSGLDTDGLDKDEIRRGLKQRGVVLYPRALGDTHELWLIVDVEGEPEPVAGRLDPDYLFDPDGLDHPPSCLGVHLSSGALLYSSDGTAPTKDTLRRHGLGTRVSGELDWDAGDGHRLGIYREIFTTPQFGVDFVVSLHDSRSAVLKPVSHFERAFLLIVLLTTAIVILAGLVRIRRITTPVQALVQASERIARQDFEAHVEVGGRDEFASIGRAFNAMSEDLRHRTEVMTEINEFGRRLTVETDPQVLIRKLVRGAARILRVDGVIVHTVGASGRLELNGIRIQSLGIEPSGDDQEADDSLGLRDAAPRSPSVSSPSLAESEDEVQNLLNILRDAHAYTVRDSVGLPMLDHEGTVIGSLTIVNAEDAQGNPIEFGRETVALAASLAGQAAVAVENARLRLEFKGLFDAMIETLAVAVDEKSPYTGNHCRRVPRLAMMLIDEMQAADRGSFADTSFSPHEVYEMQVASLLHDCGKVVTPVHVVDKATKLETIWDRIQMIDQRFAVAAHETEATELRKAAEAAGIDLTEAERRIAESIGEIQADREFLRVMNRGDRIVHEEEITRVQEIGAERTWRDLDGTARPMLEDDEVENLTIRHGTLNDDERQIINRHMDATIRMLENLPFPERLRNVPRIAGSHHERLDGRGFPYGLVSDQIPIQGRILAIADVFEALTASDRPYKKEKSPAQAIEIMGHMARSGHLDPHILELFEKSGIAERYAAEVLGHEAGSRQDSG